MYFYKNNLLYIIKVKNILYILDFTTGESFLFSEEKVKELTVWGHRFEVVNCEGKYNLDDILYYE